MAPSAAATQSQSSKIKRPVPPGIQTNGIHSSTSSPSPSMSASRLPSGAKPPNSANSNGIGNGNSGVRSANRRRDAPPQLLGRGQRNSSVGLRSASVVGDSAAVPVAGPQPYSMYGDAV
jgi:transcription factor SPT20